LRICATERLRGRRLRGSALGSRTSPTGWNPRERDRRRSWRARCSGSRNRSGTTLCDLGRTALQAGQPGYRPGVAG